MHLFVLTLLAFFSLSHAGDFDEPECMKPSIDFWEKVYTVYDKDDVVAHNPETFEVYKVIKKDKNLKVHRANVAKFRDSMAQILPKVKIRFQTGVKTRFNEGLRREEKYRHIVEAELARQGLPMELRLLPHVESSYDPRARSHVGARGMWQIMPRTGRVFGARGKNLHDVHVATPVAINILRFNYSETGSWPMALMGYNHGLAGVKRAMSTLGTSDVCVVVEKHSSKTFKFASKNFYAQFLAVKRIMDCRDKQ